MIHYDRGTQGMNERKDKSTLKKLEQTATEVFSVVTETIQAFLFSTAQPCIMWSYKHARLGNLSQKLLQEHEMHFLTLKDEKTTNAGVKEIVFR